MVCPECDRRRARRECPALAKTICSVCCGTKRLKTIRCPADCVYLASSREHPAAVVKRQQERDLALLLPTIRDLTERQHQLFFLFQTLIARHRPDGFTALLDADVAEAAATVATTLETAAKGVIFEQSATTRPAEHLAREMKKLLADARQQGATIHDREAAIVLRAIETGARGTHGVAGGDGRAYLELMGRLLQTAAPQDGSSPDPSASPIIVP